MVWQELRRPEEREPKHVATLLADVSRRFGLAEPGVLGVVFAGWEGVVGSVLANNVRPIGLRDGVLMLEVQDPAWLTQVQFLQADLLTRLRAATGTNDVCEISVRVARTGRKRPRVAEAGSEAGDD